MLKSLQPSETIYALVKAMFKKAWDMCSKQVKDSAKAMQRKLVELEVQIAGPLDRIVEATSPLVITAYEARIDDLEKEKLVLSERLSKSGKPQRPFDEMFQLACRFLSSPWKIWETGDLALRRTVLRLVFEERLSYCRNEGLPTPKTTLPFKVLDWFCTSEEVMAETKGDYPICPFARSTN